MDGFRNNQYQRKVTSWAIVFTNTKDLHSVESTIVIVRIQLILPIWSKDRTQVIEGEDVLLIISVEMASNTVCGAVTNIHSLIAKPFLS